MTNVFCIGEILIDFIAEKQGNDLEKARVFNKKAGGAPANVAVCVAKLGAKSYFAGAVGRDTFGEFLISVLKDHSVITDYIQEKDFFTTLAFVSLSEDGERDFVFNRGADALLKYDEGLTSNFKNSIVHFGAATAFLGSDLEKTYTLYLNDALKSNAFISFDPNFRTDLWKKNEKEFIKKCLPFIERADFAKFSLEELQLLSGEKEIETACEKFHKNGVKIIAVTMGAMGTFLSTRPQQKTIGSIKVKAVDTTGAGDAFVGCFLKQLSELENPKIVVNDFPLLSKMVKKANIAGAIATTKYGAIASLPTWDQIEKIVSNEI